MTAQPQKRVVVITGMSGGGKSTAIRALEDANFFCVDNMPALLVPKLLELAGSGAYPRVALVIDAREGEWLKDAPRVLAEVRRAGHELEVLFLDSSDDALIRRFSETRRRHPIAPESTVSQGIKLERELLRDLREMADQVIDTSAINVHDLKRMVQGRFAEEPNSGPSISVISFGYRYGVPPQADLVFDCRFLPNPYFIPELKGLTGKNEKVAAYVLERPETQLFMEKIVDLCRFLFPKYQREGKAYLTVALGCTGGKHRSVAIAADLAKRLNEAGDKVQTWHRDSEKE